MRIDEKLDCLGSYMDIYIQLLTEMKPINKYGRLDKYTMPTFEEHLSKKGQKDDMNTPTYKRTYDLVNGKLITNYLSGLGQIDGDFTMHYANYKGVDYSTSGVRCTYVVNTSSVAKKVSRLNNFSSLP